MKRKAYQVAVPATLVVVILAVLFTLFFANVILSFATSDKNKSSAIVATSGVEPRESRGKLWKDLTIVMRENEKDMDTLTKAMTDSATTMSAVEHMKLHRQITEAHLDQLKKFIPPFEALYADMSDEEKNSADEIFRIGKYGKSRR